MTYDYIIVGSGSAGSILANRLSASGQHQVLVLEAGGKDTSPLFRIPVGFAKLYYNETYNWMYNTVPQPHLGGRSLYAPRGKVQGGSGSINAMIYVRGLAHDFDDWAAAGNPGWSFADVLPAFKRLETHARGASGFHGDSGPIHITPMQGHTHPITDAYLRGCAELGYPATDDFNGPAPEGAGVYDVNTRNGQRCSSSFAYLHPALKRPNLHIQRNTLAECVLLDENRRAVSVQVLQHGERHVLHARREIILAAGAVDSPKLLQLSGIGDPALLSRHGIALRHALPAVGQHLQDHLCASYYYRANIPTLNDTFSSWGGRLKLGLQYALRRSGPLAMSVNQAGGFFRGTEGLTAPNLQLYFNPLSYQIPKSQKASIQPEPYSGFLLCFNPCRPTSRGSVQIASAGAADAARIDPNYLATDHDVREVIQGSRLVRQIMQSPALRTVTVEEVLPGKAVDVDDEAAMLTYFRDNSGSIYHLCGSCAMGPDPATSVVDARLRVHGVAGLRVVDASIFPNVTSGNTNAATMMVAERGADMILDDA